MGGRPGLQVLAVGRDRALNIEGNARKRRRELQEGDRVFRPQDHAVHGLRAQIHAGDSVRVVRVAHEAEALLQPAAQPGEVEGGDVRPAAGADDHCAPTSSTTRSSSRAMARKRRTTGEELLFK